MGKKGGFAIDFFEYVCYTVGVCGLYGSTYVEFFV